MEFEPVIGLEVHAQLLTKTKIFCRCSTEFGAPSNSRTCPVCLGLPGALPVLNRESVAMAVKAGLALGCRISPRSVFARKNYFYPDLPKGYQISQYDQALAVDGKVTLRTGERVPSGQIVKYQKKAFGIIRVHLEEDAGKSIHMAGDDTYVDLNRSGVPLIEIVSDTDLRSSQEAYDYLVFLRRTLLYLGICDGNMEEGSLRCDANVSVRPLGASRLGTKIEIKNLNSFRFLQKALDYEIQRQIDVIERGGTLEQETRLWDEERQKTFAMRSKEEAHDYRYFPEPDLLPVVITSQWLESLKKEIPELPEARADRFVRQFELSEEDAFLITQTRPFADYFETAVDEYNQPKSVLNWMVGDLTRLLKRDDREVEACLIEPKRLARMLQLVDEGTISGKIAKDVFGKMYQTGKDPETVIAEEDLKQISGEGQLEPIIDEVLASNQKQVEVYRSGKEGLLGFFVGQAMKKTRGQANPKVLNEMLKKKLLPPA